MKLVTEKIDSVLVIDTEDNNFKMALDIETGEIIHLEYADTNVHQLAAFVSKAKTSYNKHMRTMEIDEFIQ